MKVERMGITEFLGWIWLFSTNKTKSSESFSKQPTQLIVDLNSSLRHIIVTLSDDDYPMTTRWLADDCLMTARWLPDDCWMTAQWLSDDCPMTVWLLRWELRHSGQDKCTVENTSPVQGLRSLKILLGPLKSQVHMYLLSLLEFNFILPIFLALYLLN